jgi:hypothetical protein
MRAVQSHGRVQGQNSVIRERDSGSAGFRAIEVVKAARPGR